ncbi:MAG: ABC transporter substrate-binding protein, partial [Actinomycetes bacterium]
KEDTPLGSYPQLRAAVEAAVAWVNTELGGVDGHPIEFHPCITRFDAEQSRACAVQLRDAGVVALVGGVDVTSSGSIAVIEQSGLVSIGGIPATLEEQRSPDAFYFSGGDAGALAGFMDHAARRRATRVALLYGQEVESFRVAASDYGAIVGRSRGLQVDVVPYSIFTTNFTPVLAQVAASGADAVMVLAATTACIPVMQAAAALHPRLPLYLTGACAADEIVGAAGAASRGVTFNAEGPVDGTNVDASVFRDVVARYAREPAGGAGTVGFRGFMNLYALLREVGADHVSAAALIARARAAVDHPSFWGHPYTCDGRQVPGMPALCAPQQVLFERSPGGAFRSVSGWIPTDRLFARAFG